VRERIPSHLSLSRSDSFSTLSGLPKADELTDEAELDVGPAFTFTALRHLSAHAFNRKHERRRSAAAPTGAAPGQPAPDINYGVPTVMDVGGMIAVGTDGGWVLVYAFNQEVRCVLGNETTVASGPVTAVTVCPDQTFIGVGHVNGNIFLYDLKTPAKPARTQLALPLRHVLSGRKEGHLQGSRILHIGFVGKRHTSIVTGDEDGRAFWFSLGRVLGVDSNDAVRMLGSYPEKVSEAGLVPGSPGSGASALHAKRPTTLFAVLPLPLGPTPHTTDPFHFSALLTPVKIVVVGMKPTAKTWFRTMRGEAGGPLGGYVGCAAWLRSGEVTAARAGKEGSDPVLAYAWGTSLRFLRVKVVSSPSAKDKKGEPTRVPEFVEGRRWEAPHAIQSLHWFDADHMLLVTTHQVLLLNVRSMTAVENMPLQTKLLTSHDVTSHLRRAAGLDVPPSIAASCRTNRDKLFLLTRANVQAGTLQHWNDRVLAHVHRGSFLAAINLALAYYEGRAPGNTIGLPDIPDQRRAVVGARVRELMHASLEWAFSEERMRDDTHFSADGRGVDLTALFEGLATACIDACIALRDMDFLFNDAYEHFANAGIQNIFLARVEGYVFDGGIAAMPPNAVQALLRMHDERGEYALAESIIWHVDAASLDINQAVMLCEKHGLWDALIHVYTRAMRDYTAPVVRLVRIVCDVQRRRQVTRLVLDSVEDDRAPDAYKLYAYIAHVLSGLWYPSGEAMREQDGIIARTAVYEMLFSDHSVYWPQGSHDLVLTDRDEPYPYLRLLLRFDTEAFLHAMDIAFEDPFLNDSGRSINRQSIINLMLDVMDTDFYASDVTLLHIFVARNLPKYPQFIFIPPSTSHRILVSLAADTDQSTREDRQLAAEYLLSAYRPQDADEMLARFEDAAFFRILRAAYRRDRKWGPLIGTLLRDPDTDSAGVFTALDEVIADSKGFSGTVPPEVSRTIGDALPQLFELSVTQIARLLDRALPSLHETAIAALAGSDHKQAAYLRCLLSPDNDDGDADSDVPPPSTHLPLSARHQYISLLAKHDASSLLPFLDARGPSFFDLPRLAQQCEDASLPDAQVWALDRAGDRAGALATVDAVLASRGADLAAAIAGNDAGGAHVHLGALTGVAHMAVRLCREHAGEGDDRRAEDMWFGVLHSVTELVHSVSALGTNAEDSLGADALAALRALVQDALQALLATPAKVSFARLFKRLVEAAPGKAAKGKTKSKGKGKDKDKADNAASGRAYSEFRTILTGMLDAFRADADLLALSIRMIEADGFDLLSDKVAQAAKGWRPSGAVGAVCAKCGRRWVDGVLRADGCAVCSACVAAHAAAVEQQQ
jgi:hypothetical protein